MKEQASLTAVTAARGRAAHLLSMGSRRFFTTSLPCGSAAPIAKRRSAESIDAMLAGVAAKAGPDAAQQSFRVARASMLMRSRYTEDALSLAMARGITRYVILGAGLDSFAWRRRDLADAVQVFEIDHPASQRWKRRRFELGIGPPSNLTFLPIDFERQTLVNGLRDGGYPLDKPAFISWLGVTQYLTSEAVFGTLKEVATLARGTEISFTFIVSHRLYGSAMASGCFQSPWHPRRPAVNRGSASLNRLNSPPS